MKKVNAGFIAVFKRGCTGLCNVTAIMQHRLRLYATHLRDAGSKEGCLALATSIEATSIARTHAFPALPPLECHRLTCLANRQRPFLLKKLAPATAIIILSWAKKRCVNLEKIRCVSYNCVYYNQLHDWKQS